MTGPAETRVAEQAIKSCCARLYEQDVVRLLLGESYHPGGLELTSKLGKLMELSPATTVLDVASGTGASALHIAQTFGCDVMGIDYSQENVRRANEAAVEAGLDDRVRFQAGDSERLPFDTGSFDAVICECAFCTFPDKRIAAAEIQRVLSSGGKFGLSDITRADTLPAELQSLMAWVACIADAQPIEQYSAILETAGFRVEHTANEDSALKAMVSQIRLKLLGLEVAVGLKKLDLPDVDFVSAKQMAAAALHAIDQGQLGYALIQATHE